MLRHIRMAGMLLAVLLVACSSGRVQSPGTVPAGGFLFIAFENGTTETATVFVEAFPTEAVAFRVEVGPRRLGRVRPSSTQRFRIQAPPVEFAFTASFETLSDAETERLRGQAGDSVMVATQENGPLTVRVQRYSPPASSRMEGHGVGAPAPSRR